MRLLLLFCFIIITNHLAAQTKNDPLMLRDDGLPVTSPRDSDLQDNDRTREDYQPTRQHIPGTINRTDEPEQQPLEYRSEFEAEEQGKHFENDASRGYLLDSNGKPIKSPTSIDDEVPKVTPDTSGVGGVKAPK
jgi:hypothetical protein